MYKLVINKTKMSEQDPSLRPDENHDYPELQYSSAEDVIEWYHSIGSFRIVVTESEYKADEGMIPNRELFHAAGRMYMYATGMTSEEVQSTDQKDAMRYVMRAQNLEREIEDPALALEAATALMEVGESVGNDGAPIYDVCKTIFATLANEKTLDAGSAEIGALPKYNAVRYLHDIETIQIRAKLKQGELTMKDATEEYRQSNLRHAKRFLDDMFGATKFKNGDAYEHFIEIVARHANWVNGSIAEWSVKAAKPRQDILGKSVRYDDSRKSLSFDTLFVSEVTGEIQAIQSKAGNSEREHDYSELIAIVDTLDGYTDEGEKRDYMETITRMIRADYNGRSTPEKDKFIEEEFAQIGSKVSFI